MLMGSALMQIHDAVDSGKAARMITVIIFPTMVAILFFCLDQTPFTKAEEKKNNKSDIESSVVNSKSEEEEKETSERLTKAEMLLAFKEIRFLFIPLCKIYYRVMCTNVWLKSLTYFVFFLHMF